MNMRTALCAVVAALLLNSATAQEARYNTVAGLVPRAAMDEAADAVAIARAAAQSAGAAMSSFDLPGYDGNDVATGIALASGRFHVVDIIDDKVYAYTAAGQRDTAADFDLDGDNAAPQGIAFCVMQGARPCSLLASISAPASSNAPKMATTSGGSS